MTKSFKLPEHPKDATKGQRGRVIVVGGSPKYYGAPILTALGAEKAGADLITLYLPAEHAEVAKNTSLNFFIKNFTKEKLTTKDSDAIINDSQHSDVLVIGNGIGKDNNTQKSVISILQNVSVPCVIDAEALIPDILKIKRKNEWVVTPHSQEFLKLFEANEFKPKLVKEMAKLHKLTILKKGMIDYISDQNGNYYENKTGCKEMRVGGTGDVLAGIIASFIAQGLSPFEATKSAIHHYGKKAQELTKARTTFTAKDLAKTFSYY